MGVTKLIAGYNANGLVTQFNGSYKQFMKK